MSYRHTDPAIHVFIEFSQAMDLPENPPIQGRPKQLPWPHVHESQCLMFDGGKIPHVFSFPYCLRTCSWSYSGKQAIYQQNIAVIPLISWLMDKIEFFTLICFLCL